MDRRSWIAAGSFVSGSLDIGISTPISLAQAFTRNLPFPIVAGGAMNTMHATAMMLLVGADAPLREPKDFEGKTIALSAWFSTPAFIQKNPALVKAFAAAIHQTGRWANSHHDEYMTILVKYSGGDLETLKRTIHTTYAESLQLGDLQPQLDVAFKYGMIPRQVAAVEMIAHYPAG